MKYLIKEVVTSVSIYKMEAEDEDEALAARDDWELWIDEDVYDTSAWVTHVMDEDGLYQSVITK